MTAKLLSDSSTAFTQNGCFAVPAPLPKEDFNADVTSDLYSQYHHEEVPVCTPKDVIEMLVTEQKRFQKGDNQQAAFEDSYLRDFYKTIPQPLLNGPNGINPTYSCSTYLMHTALVGYFDTSPDPYSVEEHKALYLLLKFEEGAGWAFPTLEDGAYQEESPHIAIQDAVYDLVKKEVGLGREHVSHQFLLAFFDDRKKGTARTCETVNFVLLNKRPKIEKGKQIAVPLNVLVHLSQRQIKLSPEPNDENNLAMGMAKGHDSMMIHLINTARFCNTMHTVKKWHEQKGQEQIKSFPGAECPSCTEFMAGVKVICTEGHSICQLCVDRLKNCPSCKKPLLKNPVPNPGLESMIQTIYPDAYREKIEELKEKGFIDEEPEHWASDPLFFGRYITYIAD